MIADIMTSHGKVQSAGLREPIVVHDTISIIRLMDTLKRSWGNWFWSRTSSAPFRGWSRLSMCSRQSPESSLTRTKRRTLPPMPQGAGQSMVPPICTTLNRFWIPDGLVDDEQDYTTLAGYLLERFGHLPSAGDASM